MCGICGIFNLDGEPVSPVNLRKMTDAIAHRGPDGEGFFIDSFLGLGHRRLAIIDLSPLGHQPMVSRDGQYTISYNGEVYNFQELRAELEALGCPFRSRSDTEVVLNAYTQWGPECVNRFNGMFAFAIWDKTRQELFWPGTAMASNPFITVYSAITFCSLPNKRPLLRTPRLSAGSIWKRYWNISPFRIYLPIKPCLKVFIFCLPAAMPGWLWVHLGRGSSALDITRYWDYNFNEPEVVSSDEEYVEELDRLFRQAVNRQLVSDVELGAYLSGGMDSGSITAIAATQLPYIKTFTCGFDLNSASGLELRIR